MTDKLLPKIERLTDAQIDWLRRYMARIVAAGFPEAQARGAAAAESFAVLSEDYEDDPEGAAEMEMSYWTD